MCFLDEIKEVLMYIFKQSNTFDDDTININGKDDHNEALLGLITKEYLKNKK